MARWFPPHKEIIGRPAPQALSRKRSVHAGLRTADRLQSGTFSDRTQYPFHPTAPEIQNSILGAWAKFSRTEADEDRVFWAEQYLDGMRAFHRTYHLEGEWVAYHRGHPEVLKAIARKWLAITKVLVKALYERAKALDEAGDTTGAQALRDEAKQVVKDARRVLKKDSDSNQ